MLLIDVHTHLYDCYETGRALRAALSNLRPPPGSAGFVRGCCLAERPECRYFERIRCGETQLPEGWTLLDHAHPNLYAVCSPVAPPLWLVRGCQIQTRERLEVSGMFCGQPAIRANPGADEAIAAIAALNGLPALHWAFGKWLFAREKMICRIAGQYAGQILLSDSSTRFIGWPMPSVLKKAHPLLAGSDPLPVPGEERLIGSYAVQINAPFDSHDPEPSIRNALLRPPETPRLIGRRDTLFRAAVRQMRYHCTREATTHPAC